MKRITLLLLLNMMSLVSLAQFNYTFTISSGTPGYVYDEPNATTILDESLNGSDGLSTWQTLPFAWNFYDTPVTGYYASDNGYITFENTANQSVAMNEALPSIASPNQAIYACWDDWLLKYSNWVGDKIKTVTLGTAPNRIHIIQWVGVTSISNNPNHWAFFAIRIHENGDFDIVHDGFNGGAANNSSVTVGVENGTGDLSTTVMGPNDQVEFGSTSSSTDGYVFDFTWEFQEPYDLSFDAIRVPREQAVGDYYLEGIVTNLGSQTVNSFDVSFVVNGTDIVNTTVTGVNIATYETDTFVTDGFFTFTTPGELISIEGWTGDINGNPDADLTNNSSLTGTLFTTNGTSAATKEVLLEETTGVWCSPCILGIAQIDTIHSTYPDAVNIVALHGGSDPMATTQTQQFVGTYSASFPNGFVDREAFADFGLPNVNMLNSYINQNWLRATEEQLEAWTPASISFEQGSTFNDQTLGLDVNLKVDFADYAIPGDLRTVLYVVEDAVTENDPQYNQQNPLSGNTFYAWLPYTTMPNPITNMTHKHVFRMSPNMNGNPGVIGGSPVPGDSYTETISATLDPSWDQDSLTLIAFVYYYNNSTNKRHVLNSTSIHLTELNEAGQEEVEFNSSLGSIEVYPIPSSDHQLDVSFTSESSKKVVIELYDMTGRLVDVTDTYLITSGENEIHLNYSSINDGMYNLRLNTEGGGFIRKVYLK